MRFDSDQTFHQTKLARQTKFCSLMHLNQVFKIKSLKIDVVIPIPDTSRTSAMQVAHKVGAKYREGFMKNRYIGRTFIMPGQTARKKSVSQKLNPIEIEFKGKCVKKDIEERAF